MSSPFLSRNARVRRFDRPRPLTNGPPVAAKRQSHAERKPLRHGELPPDAIEMVLFELTSDPIADPPFDRLPARDRERILDAGAASMKGDPAQVPVLEQLVRKFPDVPKVHNFLSMAYKNTHQYDESREWVEKTYRRFPDYLFGIVNYCHMLLTDGRIDEVTDILGGRFSLHRWIPDRRTYHISEFVSFTSVMVAYFVAMGKVDVARTHLAAMKKVAPDHPATRETARWCEREPLRARLRRLRGRGV